MAVQTHQQTANFIWSICNLLCGPYKRNEYRKGEDSDNIKPNCTFEKDGFSKEKFDYILADPPFGVEWKQQQKTIENEKATFGYDGRFGAGTPRINDGSFLFLQHMISKMRSSQEGGSRIGIVFNGSPLFNGNAGIRQWIIENDWLEAMGEKDDTAEICRDAKGNPEADANLCDTENVPLKENIEKYFKREVLPHVPDSWIDHSKTKVGYEIPLNRHFYSYEPSRTLEDIAADVRALGGNIEAMLAEITGSAGVANG